MHNLLKMYMVSFACLAGLGVCSTAYGLDSAGRAAYNNVTNTARAGMSGSMRMPTMPTLSINTTGNLSPNLPDNNGYTPPTDPGVTTKCPSGSTGTYPNCVCEGNKIYNVKTNTCDDCEYSGQIVVNGACVCPDGTHVDVATKSCVKDSECPDGGVKDSDYTVTNCMNDIYACINNGALPNGINDLFNEDLRNSIENGMALCSVQVERCITEIRRNCKNVYRSSADVWIDFNARKVQPEYYNFVLRKTGLTPNQAENTCLLLDRNTYGSSFAAVANNGSTTAEYNNRVGAYNSQQGNVLIKSNPQGAKVNTGHSGVDGQRGHYARWDATTADCYIRISAYNKDDQIKNSWLFGAVGDDRPAEAWGLAGQMFSCNKDLFGFSLMKDTNTVAVVGVGGGTLVGAGIGALAGHGARNFNCSDDNHRKKLMEQLKKSGQIAILNEYMLIPISTSADMVTVSECNEISDLYQTYMQAISAIADCGSSDEWVVEVDVEKINKIAVDCTLQINGQFSDEDLKKAFDECFKANEVSRPCAGKGFKSAEECVNWLKKQNASNPGQIAEQIKDELNVDNKCMFKHINRAAQMGSGLNCTADTGCITADELAREAKRLGAVFSNVEILKGEKNNRVKTTLVGAGIGAGAGGLATGITALIEHKNINCRVGDGLAKVGYGKSYNIETLKDFYVKWNLHLPDTISPTGVANDCNSWRALCGALTDEKQCNGAQINYRGPEDKTITLIRSACKMSGSQCIENYSVAKSYGACE